MTRERTCQGCDGYGGLGVDHSEACEPCHGTGRVLEAITVSDAMADAETLHGSIIDELDDRHVMQFWRTAMLAYAAQSLQPHYDACDFGTEAARAAFRAVPGLREE